MSWKLVRLLPRCDSCLLSDDFEGQTNGSEVFPDGGSGAKRTVELRVKPFLGECRVTVLSVIWFNERNYCSVLRYTFWYISLPTPANNNANDQILGFVENGELFIFFPLKLNAVSTNSVPR